MFKGSIPALITPFKNGEIDWKVFDHLVEWQIDQGSHGLVPCGTTGESPTLSDDEHAAIVERCIDVVKGRIPVIAGAGSNSTEKAIALTQHAKEAGADASLNIVPYYNKPTQDGMFAHFKAIHDAVGLPMILYNVPGRTVADMKDETVVKLAELPQVIGIKDATGDMARPVAQRRMIGKKGFCLLSGDDASTPAYLAQGGDGCITVVGNVAPALCAQMHEAWWNRDLDKFAETRDLLDPLANDLFCESSPAPVKYAASTLGLCSADVRLPLLSASETAREKVNAAMAHAGLSHTGKRGSAAA